MAMTNPKMVVIRAESLPRDEKREIKKDRTNPIHPAGDVKFVREHAIHR